MKISAIVCSHNPRPDYLRRTLDALRAQTLPAGQWELLLVDNASREPLAGRWDLSWHPAARHVLEKELGLTPARLRGFRESAGEILVFVDDDNLPAPDYLENTAKILGSHPWVGAIGGNVRGEFETAPEPWMETMLPSLAIVSVTEAQWAFRPGAGARGFAPAGAGMAVRRPVMEHYAGQLARDPFRKNLDRKGGSLMSGGDTDIALCACALGLAVGRFPQLQLVHLIPSVRLGREYLLKLAEGLAYSDIMVRHIWDKDVPELRETAPCRAENFLRAYVSLRRRLRGQRQPDFAEEVQAASRRGIARAAALLKSPAP